MATDGSHAFPSEDLLALETGLTSRAVSIHLQTAVEHGWILRHRERRRGKAWAQYFYQAVIPDLPDTPERRSLPHAVGTEPDSQGTERNSTMVPNDVPPNTAGVSTDTTTAPAHISADSRAQRPDDCAAILAEIKRRGSLLAPGRTRLQSTHRELAAEDPSRRAEQASGCGGPGGEDVPTQ